jgi:hypothetical protein
LNRQAAAPSSRGRAQRLILQASNLSAMADGEPPTIGVGDRVGLLATIVDLKADFAMVNVEGVTPPSTYICVDYASLLPVQEPGGPEPGP